MEIDRPQIQSEIIRNPRKLAGDKDNEAVPSNGDCVSTASIHDLQSDSTSTKVQTNRSRCFCCSKKVGLAGGLECRCGYVYCTRHRYPEQHNCNYDFRDSDRSDLKKIVIGGGSFIKVDAI